MSREIDAVFVATPDNHHAPASMMAIRLGKHVYCEKPLTHDIHEARQLTLAAREHKVATQMGNQGRAEEGWRLLCELIWAGADRARHGGARLDGPPGNFQAVLVAAGRRPSGRLRSGAQGSALGYLAGAGARAAVSGRVQGGQVPGEERLPALRMARLVGLRHRRLGRHRLPRDERNLLRP